VSLPRLTQPFVIGSIPTPSGLVPRVATELGMSDHWGTFKARWGVGRMNYTVDPGLYAVGDADETAPVLVTANYKMSFDNLRAALAGRSAWILVLETKGINVWCAAGKGTFGTQELVDRIHAVRLHEVVSHHTVIVPQLAGPGVAAHEVKRLSGFRVVYGPIRATDVCAFLDRGRKCTPEMRLKTFDSWERFVLIPVELVDAFKAAAWLIPAFVLVSGFGGSGSYWSNVMSHGLFAAFALMGAIVAGAIVTPILLPWLPGRAFSTKGVIPGVIVALTAAILKPDALSNWPGRMEIAGWFFLVPAIATYLSMNFTGASTYTSLSGVKKEMGYAVPAQIGAAVAGTLLWLGSRFSS
jgi:hypothetical protein